ncbi:hypothetical protein OIE68_45960 [Nocardia vinacea]|uniref:hypothetical protein n=1 Tax=Nocardia vinacea TaxID=96468 RepID=UPI002E15CB04|nr:hypothetical protein OIE68_45960 [Nocardia vinacea]
MQITPGDVLEAIARTTAFVYTETVEGFEFDSRRRSGWDSLTLSSTDLARIVDEVNSYSILDEAAVALKSSAEMLVRGAGSYSQNSLAAMGTGRDDFVASNDSEGISYTYGRPSDSYLAYILISICRRDSPPRLLSPHFFGEMGRTRRGRGGTTGLFTALRSTVRIRVLKIESSQPVAPEEWSAYADDFFFHIGYSINAALIRHRYLDDMLWPVRTSNMRHLRSLDAPKRTYISDLVYHYQLGLATESPMLEYVSYYHVMEHWFEAIVQQGLIVKVQSEIMDPSFSYKNTKDIQRLIRLIAKTVQSKDDDIVFNEQTALRLTLDRYVRIDRLVEEISIFDPNLLDYYARNIVEFSAGDRVELRCSDPTDAIAAWLTGPRDFGPPGVRAGYRWMQVAAYRAGVW